MGVVRATDSKNLTREGFCKLLVKIVNDTTGTFKTEYSAELAKYLKGVHPSEIGYKYSLSTTSNFPVNEAGFVKIEIPAEFLPKNSANRYVELLIQNPIFGLKFNIREVPK